jgi:hypothetical protein
MANRIQLRRGSAQEWSNVNPTLAIGELGIEIDTGRIKIGDGVTSWNSLKYERPLESITNTPNTLVQRDADGNFQAGAITGSLIGNAATATRLANTRQIALTGDVTASATFDGSANLNLSSALQIVPSLPHYDGTITSSGSYTKVTVDAKGRITNASNPNNIADYNLDGILEGISAQGFDRDLQGIADLSTTGIITRVSDGNIATRTVTGTAGRISVTNGSGVSGNPTLDLINTTVTPATYNTPTIASATQTINATKFTVDQFGRFTYAEDFPIATAVEGTTSSAWVTGTSYARYAKVTSSGRLYQAVNAGTSGATAPVHTSGDASDGTVSWRHLGLVTTRQKGLASFDQEDFDVDVNGHVQIASAGVDNTQLQNNQIRFADGSSYTAYELDNELTASTGYRGITTINDLSVNNTGGSPLLKCLAADDNVDINTTTSTIFSDITLDKTSNAIQTINRAGSLTLLMDANSASNRFLRLTATNVGTGEAKMEVSVEDSISIDSINSTLSLSASQQISLISSGADVRVEDFYFANNVLSSTNSTIVLDPAGIGDDTGTVQIKGNLQVDGTTTTVNSTTITIDDVILTLGGDQTPTTDDNKDRGIEFKYYDTQARLGFYGWDDSYTTLAGTTGGYRFIYNATNTSEVFTGTDAGVIAGNLALSSNVGSTSTTTGTLVVTGGAGISENLWVGGTANVAGNTTLQGTLGVTNLATFNNGVTIAGNTTAATEYFRITDGAGSPVTKFLVDTANGNTSIEGTVTVTDNVTLNKNVTIVGSNTAATEFFKIQNASATDKFVVDSSSGNTTISGTLGVTGATTLSSTLGVTGATTLTGNLTTQGSSFIHLQNTDAPTVTVDGSNNYVISGGDYGTLRNDGGGYFGQDVLFSQDIYVNGAINVKDAGDGGTASTVNSLTVRYRSILGSILAYTPSFATDTNSNARITGGAGIATTLHIGGTSAGQGLFVGKRITSDTAKFSVLGASGNTSISGTLGVAGITSITNATDSSATNNGALVITGGVGIGAQLRVAGDTTLTGDLAVNGGDLTTNQSTFNLLASPTTVNFAAAGTTVNIGATTGTCTIRNANTVITGNLTVNGTTTTVNATTITVDDPVLTLGGDTAPSSDDNKDRGIEFRYFDVSAKLGFFGWDDSSSGYRFLENATNTSEVFSGTDARIYAGRLNLSSNITSTSSTTGSLIVTGGVGISENLNVGGTTTLTGLLDANGGATIDNVRIGITADNEIDTTTGNLIIDSAGGTTTIDDATSITGITTITNATSRTIPAGASLPTLAGALQVTGGAHIGENFVVNGDLKVYGAAVYQGGIDYQGTQTYSGIIKQTNTSDAASSTDLTSSISTAGGVAIAKKLFVGTNASIGGTLGVAAATTLSSTLGVTGLITANAGITIVGSAGAGEDFTITNGTVTKFTVGSADGSVISEGNLTVKGNTILGDAVGDTITVNGTATFNNADIVGTVRDARQWTTARTLSFTGDATGSMSVTGAANASASLTLATVATAGTYRSVTINAKGLVTSGTNPTTLAGYGITDAQGLDADLTAVAGLSTTGIIVRSGAGTAVTRSVTVSGTGLSVTNGDGILGNPTITSNATNNNAANTIVSRDASGNFTAGTITATLSGNSSTATALQTARTFALTGDIAATAVSFDGTGNVSLVTAIQPNSVALGTDTTGNYVASVASGSYITGGAVGSEGATLTIAVDATTTNTASKVVARDTSGNFAAGTITADLDGNASTASTLETARNINGIPFDGSADITITPVYATSNQDGDGTQIAFPVNSGRTVNDMFVIVNGLVLAPSAEYTYTNSTTKTSTGGIATNTFITVASTTGLVPGMEVSGTGIGTNAIITTIVGLQVNLSVANTGSTIGNTITFGAVVTLATAPTAGTNNVSIRYLPLLN